MEKAGSSHRLRLVDMEETRHWIKCRLNMTPSKPNTYLALTTNPYLYDKPHHTQQTTTMKALRSLSSASQRPDSPVSKSRRSSSRVPEPPPPTPPPPPPKPVSVFAFTQINVTNFDRAEAFFEKVFGWRFVGEPTSPVFVPPPPPPPPKPCPDSDIEGPPEGRVAPPVAPPPDHRVNYFTPPRKEVGGGTAIAGALALFMFGRESRAGNFGGRVKRAGETEIPAVIQYVAVDDIVVALNAVRLAGGRTVVQLWMERDGMARFALFADTEGNAFGLIQYLM
jgi:predicted enzyme related to lactoylglutathione lyase